MITRTPASLHTIPHTSHESRASEAFSTAAEAPFTPNDWREQLRDVIRSPQALLERLGANKRLEICPEILYHVSLKSFSERSRSGGEWTNQMDG